MFLHFSGTPAVSNGHISTRAYSAIALNLPILVIAWVMTSARIVVKAKIKKLGIEDLLIVIALVLVTALVTLTIHATTFGFGVHIWDVREEWRAPQGKFTYTVMAVGCMPFVFTKASMLCFYLRLAPHPRFRIICYLSIVYISVSASIITLTNIFGCKPISGGWVRDPKIHYKCVDAPAFYYFFPTVNNTATDILLMVLPIPIVMRLQLGWKSKLGIVLMFTAGFIITAVSVFSLYALYIAVHSKDPTWDGAVSWMWAMAETSVGIITACMPSMMLVAQYLRGDIKSNSIPSIPQGENATIGGSGGSGPGNRRIHEHNIGMISLDEEGSEYGMTEMGGIAKSTEVLVEPGIAK